MKPANVHLVPIIKAFTTSAPSIEPVGHLAFWSHEFLPKGWIVANGQYLRVEDYPELFEAIGVRYSQPPFIQAYKPRGFFSRLFRLRAKMCQVPNPFYRGPGMFAVPDLRAYDIRSGHERN